MGTDCCEAPKKKWHKQYKRTEIIAKQMEFLITILNGVQCTVQPNQAQIKFIKTIINFNYEAVTHSQYHKLTSWW